MPPVFAIYKSLIDAFLLQFLESKKETLGQVNSFGADAMNRVKNIVSKGKTVRGSLVLLAYSFTNTNPSKEAIKAASAVELLQTALVIHDDIMDRDSVRRGMPSVHVQYNSDSLAMCVGDALFFLAFELLGSIKTDALTMGRIIRLVGREYQSVCIAQMADVTQSAKTKKDIVDLYTYKTGRYTFAVPLMLGAILAGLPAQAGTTKETLRYLESYGVSVGILFQIRDDELDHVSHPFTKKDMSGLRRSATESIRRLPVAERDKTILHDMLTFVTERTL